MKKVFLTMTLAFATMIASAQFMVVTNINQPSDSTEWGVSNFTDNIGIGYKIDDNTTLGVMKNGEDYDLWGRYQMKLVYLSFQAPTEDMVDNMNIGIGYSLSVWDGLNIEPNYSMPLKEDEDGNREGSFKLGLSYKF